MSLGVYSIFRLIIVCVSVGLGVSVRLGVSVGLDVFDGADVDNFDGDPTAVSETV